MRRARVQPSMLLSLLVTANPLLWQSIIVWVHSVSETTSDPLDLSSSRSLNETSSKVLLFPVYTQRDWWLLVPMRILLSLSPWDASFGGWQLLLINWHLSLIHNAATQTLSSSCLSTARSIWNRNAALSLTSVHVTLIWRNHSRAPKQSHLAWFIYWNLIEIEVILIESERTGRVM